MHQQHSRARHTGPSHLLRGVLFTQASGAPESQSSLLNGDSVVGLDALWALGHVLELGDGSLCGLEGICK